MLEVKSGRAGTARKSRRSEGGFTALEVLLVVAVVAVIITFAVITLARASDHVRLVGAARELAGYIEKARLDSIRRHELGGQATVTLTGANTYSVFLDFGGNGVPVTRTYTLPDGISFTNDPLPPASGFNWRGRTTADVRITMSNSSDEQEVVSVTTGGEVSVGREVVALGAPGSTEVDPGADVNPALLTSTTGGTTSTTGGTTTTTGGTSTTTGDGTTTTTGSTTGTTGDGTTTGDATTTGGGTTTGSTTTGTTTGSTTGTTTGTTTGSTTGTTTGSTTGGTTPTCAISAATSSMNIKKNTSGTIVVTITGSTTVSASSDNTSVTVSLLQTSGSNQTFTIRSVNVYMNYTATVTFVAGCSPNIKTSVSVNVTP